MISYDFITEKGDRQVNEDSIGHYLDSDAGLFIVADGLGGHGSGDIASNYVVEQFLMRYDKGYFGSAERYFSYIFTSAQSELLEMQKNMNKDMKSTAAAVIIDKNKLSICHIGDTRVYIFGNKKILYRTLDHSVPQMLVNAGELKEKKIRFHPDRNCLLRALGGNFEIVDYDIYSMHITSDIKAVLICSDGFWEYLNEKEMLRTLSKSQNVNEWIASMRVRLLKNGDGYKKDNYSAIGIFF